MKGSLFLRVFAGYAILTVALSGIVLLLSLGTVKTYYSRAIAVELRNLGAALGPQMISLLHEGNLGEMNSLAREMETSTAVRITVIDSLGIVLADSHENPTLMDNHRTRPEVLQALTGKVGQSTRLSTTVKQEMLYVAVPLERNGKVMGALRMSSYYRDIGSLLSDLRNNILRMAAVVVVASLIAALLFSNSLTRPIRELRAASQKVASGDFDTRVLLKGTGDIKQLADSFNYMTGRTRALVAELARKQEDLRNIISSIPDGLIVSDADGRIVMTNDGFKKIAGETAVEGEFYWAVLRVSQFGELMRKAGEDRTSASHEITIDAKTYVCSVAPLGREGAHVALFHDITEVRGVEQMKKDFVLNLSHELRTPLTAIRGFLETIAEETDQKTRHYLEVVKRHADRLTLIVEDLLQLSELEDRGARLDLEETDLRAMVDNVVHIFEHRIKEKNLSLKVDAGDDTLVITADPFKLEQVLVNLIDNAVKYTEAGSIRILLRRDGRHVMIQVADTGIGIPRENLPRIFERFYVVDKSRSRKVGGTGLGLAIVKHIVLLHDGTVDVESTPGGGSVFTVVLPANPA